MNKFKLRIKKVVCGSLAGLLALSTALPLIPITASAKVLNNQTSYTVTQTAAQTATFTHEHKHSGSVGTFNMQSNKMNVTGATQSGGCYTQALTHTHEHSGTQISTGMYSASGGCYTTPVAHHHTGTGSSFTYQGQTLYTQSGSCFTTPVSHTHTPACGSQVAHHHTDACYTTQTWYDDQVCASCGEGYLYHDAGYAGHALNPNWSRTVKTCPYDDGQLITTYTCGYNEGVVGYGLSCSKTIDGYSLNCPYHNGTIYTQTCGITENSTIGTATVSANSTNLITCSVTNNIGNKGEYSITWDTPDGRHPTGTSLQCDVLGTYRCHVNFKSKNGSNVLDNDTVTFSYTAVPLASTVNFYDYDHTTLLSTSSVLKGNESATVSIPTRTGYTYTSFVDSANTVYYNVQGANVKGSYLALNGGTVNLYATYTPNNYTVTYETHNLTIDTTSIKSDTATYDSPITLSNNAKTYPGYTFDGWFNGNTKLFNTDRTYINPKWDLTNNVTLTAKYHANSYTLNYSLTKEEAVNAHSQSITYDNPYGLSAADIASRADYTGYTFNGWYDGSVKIFNEDGSNTDSGIWKFTETVNAKATYTPNPYKVYFNTDGTQAPTKILNVTYDAPYSLASEVSNVPQVEGYTFDGWVDSNNVLVFNPDGSSTEAVYNYDSDITVTVKYHQNSYNLKYNDTDTTDTNLNKSQTVTFDAPYSDINPAPYKRGYEYEGTFTDSTNFKLWDNNGNTSSSTFNFATGASDNADILTHKLYTPKIFTVKIGEDYNEDGVLDNEESQEAVTYDALYFNLSVPTARNGLTFDGYYLLGTNTCIAKYNAATGVLTKTSETWIWDDGVDWNTNPNHSDTFYLEKRWTHNPIKVNIVTETSEKTDSTKGVGEPDTYKKVTTSRTETFDKPYTSQTAPTKRGYTFGGYEVSNPNTNEPAYMWNAQGAASSPKFVWVGNTASINPASQTAEVTVNSVFTPKTITGSLDVYEYDVNTDTETAKPIALSFVYDSAYTDLPYLPQKRGCIYKGIKDKDGNLIWDDQGKKKQTVWQYIESDISEFEIVWEKKTYTLVYDGNSKTKDITFGEPVPKLDTMSRSGYTFKGYSFDFHGKTISVFDGSGNFSSTNNYWPYDVGPSGTKIYLKDNFDVNSYKITVKPNVPGKENYQVSVVYGQSILDVEVPLKAGHFFTGYDSEFNESYANEISTPIWNKDGKPAIETYYYTHDITVFSKFEAETYNIKVGDKTFKVKYGEKIKDIAPTSDKEADEEFTYEFDGWFYKDKLIFDKDGKFALNTWNLDLGNDGAAIVLDASFTSSPIPKEEEEIPEEEPEVEEEIVVEDLVPVVEQPTEAVINDDKNITLFDKVKDKIETLFKNPTVKVVTISGTISVSTLGMAAVVIYIIAHLARVYYIPDINNPQKSVRRGYEWINKYKKSRRTKSKYFIELSRKHETILLESEMVVEVRINPIFFRTHSNQSIDIGTSREMTAYMVNDIIQL